MYDGCTSLFLDSWESLIIVSFLFLYFLCPCYLVNRNYRRAKLISFFILIAWYMIFNLHNIAYTTEGQSNYAILSSIYEYPNE